MKKLLVFALLLVACATAFAQDELETTLSADVVSHYVWRGQDLGHVSLQPTLGVACHGLSLSAFGSVGLTEASDNQELDLTLSYTLGRFNVSITDYWVNDPESRYFLYDAHRTSHVFEAGVGYDFGVASLQWYTTFAGNDGVNNNGKRAYSSYAEVTVPFQLATVDWAATLGVSPYATSYYGTTGFAVTDVSLKATKTLKVTESFSIPVFGQIVANPCSQKAYLVFGFTLQP